MSRLTTIVMFIVTFLPGRQELHAQNLSNRAVIIEHYAETERVPNYISDFSFDSSGYIWLTADLETLRVFDGNQIRMLESPQVKGIPEFSISRVLKDTSGRLVFLGSDNQYIYRLDNAGQLFYDSSLTIKSLDNKDSTNGFHLNGRPFCLDKVRLTGDVWADSGYTPAASISLFRSTCPHVVINRKLYRLRDSGNGIIRTIFICELGFLTAKITKIEYDPRQNVTGLSTNGAGLYIIKKNPFYN